MAPRTGRPPKPPGEKALVKTYACPPDLWEDVKTYIPTGERSEIIQECLRRAVQRRKRELAKEEGTEPK
jgi:hypothetical protein